MGSLCRLKSTSRAVLQSFSYLEGLVFWSLNVLLLNILCDDFVGHIPTRAHEVAACPKVAPPELFLQGSEVLQHVVGSLSLYHLHHTTRSDLRRNAEQKMDVVWPHVTLEYLYVVGPANLPYQLAQSETYLSPKNRLAVLWYKYKVEMELVNRVS